jgi:hypothetical protein
MKTADPSIVFKPAFDNYLLRPCRVRTNFNFSFVYGCALDHLFQLRHAVTPEIEKGLASLEGIHKHFICQSEILMIRPVPIPRADPSRV